MSFEEVAGLDVFPVDVEGDGVCEFVDRAGGWQPVGLIDAEGSYVFRYGRNMTTRRPERLVEIEHSPTDIGPFDVGGRWKARASRTAPRPRARRDPCAIGGRQKPARAPGKPGGKPPRGRGLFTPRLGMLVVRDAELETTGEIPMGRDASWSFVRWPGALDGWHLAVVAGGELRVLDPESGSERVRIDIEPSGDIAFFAAVDVTYEPRFSVSKPRLLLRI